MWAYEGARAPTRTAPGALVASSCREELHFRERVCILRRVFNFRSFDGVVASSVLGLAPNTVLIRVLGGAQMVAIMMLRRRRGLMVPKGPRTRGGHRRDPLTA